MTDGSSPEVVIVHDFHQGWKELDMKDIPSMRSVYEKSGSAVEYELYVDSQDRLTEEVIFYLREFRADLSYLPPSRQI